jgi:hypothetical protein
MSKKNENKIALKEINLLPSLEGLVVEVPVQVLPVAIASLPLESVTSLNPVAAKPVKVIAELLKALVILHVIVPLPPSVPTAGILHSCRISRGRKCWSPVVVDAVAVATVPVTVKV